MLSLLKSIIFPHPKSVKEGLISLILHFLVVINFILINYYKALIREPVKGRLSFLRILTLFGKFF
jgi:hypothetical protein